ncbi:MAG: hypothetical protein OEV59_02055 [Deltaproteobacteria bacterium]|nr:hypothetical protein [Deltaproteobacteria bacterium]
MPGMNRWVSVIIAFIYLSIIAAAFFMAASAPSVLTKAKGLARFSLGAFFMGFMFFLYTRLAAIKVGRPFSLGINFLPDTMKLVFKLSWFLMAFGFFVQLMLLTLPKK